MTIASEIPAGQKLRLPAVSLPLRWIKLWLSRVLWHTRAYTVILGTAILVLLSLSILYLQGLIKPFQSPPYS